jgi:hypothetical protein
VFYPLQYRTVIDSLFSDHLAEFHCVEPPLAGEHLDDNFDGFRVRDLAVMICLVLC